MGRPKKENAKTTAVQVRLEPDRLAALDELVAEYRAAAPAFQITRASVLRNLLDREVEARVAGPKGKGKR